MATDVKVYFCDPQSPWQRGSNENTNGLLRQYFPKKTDLSDYTQSDLNKVALRLNQRPRETLGFQTPASKLQKVLRRPSEPARVIRHNYRFARRALLMPYCRVREYRISKRTARLRAGVPHRNSQPAEEQIAERDKNGKKMCVGGRESIPR